jgi:hypothetical protein
MIEAATAILLRRGFAKDFIRKKVYWVPGKLKAASGAR